MMSSSVGGALLMMSSSVGGASLMMIAVWEELH